MVASLAYHKYKAGLFAPLTLEPSSTVEESTKSKSKFETSTNDKIRNSKRMAGDSVSVIEVRLWICFGFRIFEFRISLLGVKPIQPEQLKQLLEQVKSGQVEIDQAMEKLRHLPFEDLGFARVDHHRQLRRGFPEVIFCPGKTTEQIIRIFESLASRGNNVLATRAQPEVFEALAKTGKFPKARYEELARTIVLEQQELPPSKSVLPIVTAGTADMPVAMEAKVTAEIMGQRTELTCDVGVAGLHRLFGCLPKLQQANIIIVVAGMEGALASVVGGLVSCPVIARADQRRVWRQFPGHVRPADHAQ